MVHKTAADECSGAHGASQASFAPSSWCARVVLSATGGARSGSGTVWSAATAVAMVRLQDAETTGTAPRRLSSSLPPKHTNVHDAVLQASAHVQARGRGCTHRAPATRAQVPSVWYQSAMEVATTAAGVSSWPRWFCQQ